MLCEKSCEEENLVNMQEAIDLMLVHYRGYEKKSDELYKHNGKKVQVFQEIPSLKKDVVNRLEDRITSSHVIIILETCPSATTQKAAELLSSEHKARIELFFEEELLVNPLENSLTPPHRIMTKDEAQSILKAYSIIPSQLPKLDPRDIIARYLGCSPGDMIEIRRPSDTRHQGTDVVYNIVG